jgi:hypothetical protein
VTDRSAGSRPPAPGPGGKAPANDDVAATTAVAAELARLVAHGWHFRLVARRLLLIGWALVAIEALRLLVELVR